MNPLTSTSAPVMTPEPGLLIAFEGIDGVGKTTQAALAGEWLSRRSGREALVIHEPTATGPHGRRLRDRLAEVGGRLGVEEEFALFLADRAWNGETNVRPALAAGRDVVLDRYYISSVAYQGARGLDLGLIRRANEAIAPRPALVILLRLDVEEALERIAARRGAVTAFERREDLLRVAGIFDALDEATLGCPILRLDAQDGINETAARVAEALQGLRTEGNADGQAGSLVPKRG